MACFSLPLSHSLDLPMHQLALKCFIDALAGSSADLSPFAKQEAENQICDTVGRNLSKL